MDINIHIDADERLCRALDNFANTLLSLVIVTEEKRQAEEAKAEVAEKVEAEEAKAEEPKTEETAPAPAPAPASAPAPAPSYTQDQLALAASGLVDAGRMTELQQLLYSYNVQALTQLPKDKYNEFAEGLRGMGAKI